MILCLVHGPRSHTPSESQGGHIHDLPGHLLIKVWKPKCCQVYSRSPLRSVDMVVVRRSLPAGRVAQWITRLPTEQKIPGSNPGTFKLFCLYCCEPFFFQDKIVISFFAYIILVVCISRHYFLHVCYFILNEFLFDITRVQKLSNVHMLPK